MLDDLDVLNDLEQLRSRYEILGELGHDGASVVYRGRSLRSDREVAIKLMGTPQPSSPKPGARLGWQVHAMNQLHHPNLIDLYAVHHLQGGAVALAMEHGRWRTLAEVIRSTGPLPPAQVELVLRDLAGALACLHRCGVVHRGVSPQSVFLDEEGGRALLAHFGIDAGDDAGGRGALVRGFAYLAPEQIEGRAQVDGAALSAQSDLYSLGLVGYAMLTGKRPWEGESLDAVIEQQKSESLPPLSALRPDVPGHLCRAIEGALDRRPARRWGSAEVFLSHLDPDAEPVGSARAIDWPGLLAGLREGVGARVQERAGALVQALGGYGISRRQGELVLAAAGLAAAVTALNALLPASRTVADRPMPEIAVAAPAPSGEGPPTPSSAPAVSVQVTSPPLSSGPMVIGRSRGVVAPRPGASRRAAAGSAVSGAPATSGRKSPIPLLGDPAPTEGPVLGDRVRSRIPPLLGTPVEPVGTGRATGSPPRVGRGGGSRR